MLLEWSHWLSSLHPEELITFLWALILVDGARYGLLKVAFTLGDVLRTFFQAFAGRKPKPEPYVPRVCALLVGYNEADTIAHTLKSVHGAYPDLEIIVLSDGSTDEMERVAHDFARTHDGVLVMSRPHRSGKSSAMNFALQYTNAEVIVVIDADSELGPDALVKIVQPFSDPRVGAVSGTVLGRRPFTNLVTWLQSYEYLNAILVGRLFAARMNLLGIVSGAFGAFRASALRTIGGWDVGPPEDLDLTLAMRRKGYRIAAAPYANAFTDMPTTWYALLRQRMRWDQSGIIRNHCRKHIDMGLPWSASFKWSDFVLTAGMWITNIVCLIGIWIWMIWMACTHGLEMWKPLFTLYVGYLVIEAAQAATIVYYSNDKPRDAWLCLCFPIMPFYEAVLMVERTWAFLREAFWRASFEDNFVPWHVRRATWKW